MIGSGTLLQPAVVGKAAVIDLVVRHEADLQVSRADRRRLGRSGENRIRGIGARLKRPDRSEAVPASRPSYRNWRNVFSGSPPASLVMVWKTSVYGSAVGVAEDPRQQREFAHPVEQRQDHRLHRHDGAVGGAGIAPRLQIMGGGDVHAGQRGSLVDVIAVPDDLGNRLSAARASRGRRARCRRDCRRG